MLLFLIIYLVKTNFMFSRFYKYSVLVKLKTCKSILFLNKNITCRNQLTSLSKRENCTSVSILSRIVCYSFKN